MAHILTKVEGNQDSEVKVTRALLSVSDKAGLPELAEFLHKHGVQLLSTGGTAKVIRDRGIPVMDVSEYTGFPEMMDGRVKTLHPKVHGGLLGVRGNKQHEADMASQGIKNIDLVILNLYPFEATVAKGGDFNTCIENIDIGGPSMLRSSAKNHSHVVICTSPNQYPELMKSMDENKSCTLLPLRKKFAANAFATSAAYDAAISSWFSNQLGESPPKACRVYTKATDLKYGCNPHQKPAAIYSLADKTLPFKILNGSPGYINLLDATNAYQLVKELKMATGLAAATSFKHVSPAGAGVAVPLSETLAKAYEVTGKVLTPAALAYVRARNADPMSSFGDFAALSDVVDVATAMILKTEVSDGIIAPGFEPEALAILSAKKNGKFIVLEARTDFTPPTEEFREVYGMGFMQKRNDVLFDMSKVEKVVTGGEIKDAVKRDMILASVCLKYTQSNSVGYAKDGQMVGVGAGQQSRVDCVKLAARKVTIWALRQHPKVLGLIFKAGVKRVDRVNARVKYIEGDMTDIEKAAWVEMFDSEPEPLTDSEKRDFMDDMDGISLSSDAFFPFRDSIDHAAKYGVSYVVQPGGSVQDDGVIKACQDYNMQMAFSDTRLFHH